MARRWKGQRHTASDVLQYQTAGQAMAEGRIQRHHLPAMWWLNLSNGDRADMMDAFERSRDIGFTLRSAVDYFET
ncbi:hypothetical protein OAH15_00300 [bacterium]|jgi:hypothetical protein|nr:hypothetical protein [bacterium]MDB4797418.1 hypothetical protein [bacterium]